MSFGLPPGEQFLSYPVAGPDNDLRPGHRRYNFVWYRPADEASELRGCSPTTAADACVSIPPPLIRREAIAEMRADAARLLAPQFHEVVRLIEEPFLQPIYDLEIAAHGVRPRRDPRRRGLRGASACRCRRHQGGGGCDGARGARCSEGDVAAALALRGGRLPVNRRIIERARHLGAYLQATQTQEERARAGRHSTDGR